MNLRPLLLTASLSGCAVGSVGCIGAPFSFPQSTIDAGPVGIEEPDAEAGAEAGSQPDSPADAGSPPEAALTDAPTPDANPDASPEAAPTCGLVTAQPHDECPLEPSSGVFPQSYPRAGAPPPGGCPSIYAYAPTPTACQCAETFNCACLAANGIAGKCKDVGGAPWIY
jgi:hypothetical protein